MGLHVIVVLSSQRSCYMVYDCRQRNLDGIDEIKRTPPVDASFFVRGHFEARW